MESDMELFKLRAQLSVLKDVKKDYPFRTIENIIQNIGARINFLEKTNNE